MDPRPHPEPPPNRRRTPALLLLPLAFSFAAVVRFEAVDFDRDRFDNLGTGASWVFGLATCF